MGESREFLKTEPVEKLLLKLSLPTVTAQLINLLYNMVDRIYIGHMGSDGALALTGVGVCMPILLIVSAFAALVGTGGAPRASICMGKDQYQEAEEIAGQSLTVLVMISAVLTAILLVFGDRLLLLFGASGNTIGFASDYLRIYAVGTVFVQLTLGMNMFITAQGFTRESMIAVLIGAGMNIALDPVFIFGLKMGVSGAALATILSQAVSAFYVMRFLLGKKTALHIRRCHLKPHRSVILPCLALGSATFIMQSTESLIQVCFNSSLLKYGGDLAVGTMTILSSLLQFLMLPAQGLSQGAQPILSYNYGAERMDRVRKAFRILLVISLGFTLTMVLLLMLFGRYPISLFTSDETLITNTARMLRIYMAGILIFGIQMSVQCVFTALGKAKHAILVASMRKLILLIPFIYLFPAILPGLFGLSKTTAVFAAEPAADVLSVTFASILFLKTFGLSMLKRNGKEQC